MKTTFLRSMLLAAAVLGISAGAANAGNVSFGFGFYSPAPVYYDPYFYPQPVYYAPSYRVVYREPYYGHYNPPRRHWQHSKQHGWQRNDRDDHARGHGEWRGDRGGRH